MQVWMNHKLGIKIAGRNINNPRYADDTTLMAEREEKLNSPLMRVKEESEKAGLKLNIQKTKIMASGSITLWQIDGKKANIVTEFISMGSKITADGDCSHEIKRRLLLGRKAMINQVLMCSVVANSLRPHGPWPATFLCPWNFPVRNTGVGCHFLLQRQT